MRRFVQGVQRQPASGISDSRLVFTLSAVSTDQSLQRACQLVTQALTLKELPLVKARAVAQGETGQKVVAVELGRLGQGGQTVWAHCLFRMAVRSARRQPVLELFHIQPDLSLAVETHTLPVNVQPAFT